METPKEPVLVDQTWQYHFCNAWRQARSDKHIGRDRRQKRNRSKQDRQFFEIPAFAAGYDYGWNAPREVTRPYLQYLEWEATYVNQQTANRI